MSDNRVTEYNILKYALLALPMAFAGFPIYVLAPDFFVTNYGMSLPFLGLILLCIRVLDLLQSPVIGFFVDRYRDRVHWIIIIALIVMKFSVAALFLFYLISPVFWFLLNVLLAVTSYNVVSISLSSLGVLWSSNKFEQTRIVAAREMILLLGVIVVVLLPGILVQYFARSDIFIYFSFIVFLVSLASLIMFLSWYKKVGAPIKPLVNRKQKNLIIRKYFFFPHIPRQLKKLLLICFTSYVASSIPMVLVLFYVQKFIGRSEYVWWIVLTYFFSAILFIPIWGRISNVYGKYKAWLCAMLLGAISFFCSVFLGQGHLAGYMLICVFTGMSLGGDLVFPQSLIAENIHKESIQSHAASVCSLYSAIVKISLIIASLICLPLIKDFGLAPSFDNGNITGAGYIFVIVPCLLKLVSAALTYRFFIKSSNRS